MALEGQSSVRSSLDSISFGLADAEPGATFAPAFKPLLPVLSASHPFDVARASPLCSRGCAAAMWALNWPGFTVIQAGVSPIGRFAAFRACKKETLRPPVDPITLFPQIQNVAIVLSVQSVFDDGGKGKVLREEATPGF